MNTASAPAPGAAPIRVLLADDEGLVRSGFKVLLDIEDDITVVGEATNGVEAVEQARATRPDVVLMDIRMPKLDGVRATSQIAKTTGLQHVRVLILTTYDTDAYVFEALQAGAGRARSEQPRDRHRAVPQPGHRPHPRQSRDAETGRPRPRTPGRHRLPNGAGQPVTTARHDR
jgi:CheY-like chemotaxis protein